MTEFAEQLKARDLELDLEWVPRGQNEEADALTNGEYSSFSSERRIMVKVEDLPFKILPRMVTIADELYADVKARREKAPKDAARAKKAGPKDRLTVRDPW